MPRSTFLRKTLPILLLFGLILPACSIGQPSKPVVADPKGELSGLPTPTSESKIVQMATQTPVPAVTYRFPTPGETVPTAADPAAVIHPATPAPQVMSLALLKAPAVTYTDTVGGLTFDYPAGWLLTDLPEASRASSKVYSFSLRSPSNTPLPKQQDTLTPGMTAIDIAVFMQGPKTLEQAINERRAAMTNADSGAPVKIESEEDWTLPGGIPAHRFLLNIGPAVVGQPGPDRIVSDMVVMLNGRMVLVNGSGDLALVSAVSASVREVK